MNTEVISQGVNWVQYKGAFHLIFRVSVDMYGQDRGGGCDEGIHALSPFP